MEGNIIEIDLIELDKYGLNIQEYLTLLKIYENREGRDIPFMSTDNTVKSLEDKRFIKDIEGVLYLTVRAEKLFYEEVVNFDELFNLYPYQTPSGRSLRAKNKEIFGTQTKDYKILSKKYLSAVKNTELHNKIIEWTKIALQDHKRRNAMEYLPAMEVYINSRGWERYADKESIQIGGNVEKL